MDEERRAEVAFTVFSTSGRPLRARAQLVAVELEAEPWLSLDGTSERPLPIAGVLQYSVGIKVPTEAEVGSYTFRLDVVGADNPDEECAEGPTVTFQAPEPVSIIQDAGLSVLEETLEEASASVAAGSVVRTDPPAGESVWRGTEVQLVLSSGTPPVVVPDVANLSEVQARVELAEAGLTVGSTNRTSDESVPAGSISGTTQQQAQKWSRGRLSPSSNLLAPSAP